MTPETFEDVLDSACQRLLESDPAALLTEGATVLVAAPDQRDLALAHVWELVPLAQRFTDPAALHAAIAGRDPAVRFASVALLLHVDARAGREHVLRWAEGIPRGQPFATSRDPADPYSREHEIALPSVVRAFGAVLLPSLSLEELTGPFAPLPVGEGAVQAFLRRPECQGAAGVATLARLLSAPRTSPLGKPLLLALAAAAAPGLVEGLVPTLAVTAHPLRQQVAWALRDLGTDAGRDALADALDLAQPLPRSRYGEVASVEGTMLEAWVQRALARPLDEAIPRLFGADVLAQPNGAEIVVLAFRLGVGRSELLASEAFADACVALLALPKKTLPPSVAWHARDALARLGSDRAEAAAARAAERKKAASGAKKPGKKPAEGHTKDRVARYRSGDAAARIAVWDELRALGDTVLADPALRAEADGVAAETIAVLARNVERIAAALRAGGYSLARPPLPPARKGAAQAIARLEKGTGTRLPRILAALYAAFDGLGLAEDPEAEESTFLDLGRSDPLVLAPPALVAKDRKRRDEETATLPASLRPPRLLYVSPTRGTTYDPDEEIADDDPLVAVLAGEGLGADARVRREHGEEEEWLVDRLRRALARGGFLGVAADEPRATALAAGLEPL